MATNHRKYPTTLHQRTGEFEEVASFSSNELSIDSNYYNRVFKLGVTKGTAYLLGRGGSRNPQQAQGHIAARLMDDTGTTAVQVTGRARLTVRASGSGDLVAVLWEGDLQNIDSRDESDNLKAKENREPFPLTDTNFTTHEYDIYFEVQPDADDAVDTSPDSGNTELYIDGYKATQTA